MDRFIAVALERRTVQIGAHPVTLPEFMRFLEQSGRSLPHGVKGSPRSAPGAAAPVTGVTQLDAAAFCEWASKGLGRACRLPSIEELDALMPHHSVTHAHGVVPDAGFWAHEQGHLDEMRGGLKPVFLCEWTRDVEEAVSARRPDRVLARIFYPPWLREGDNPLHVQAALLASESYSFVTFRVSYEG